MCSEIGTEMIVDSLPLVLTESQVSRFKFWYDGHVHDGLQHQGELFRHAGTFSIHQRTQVYDLSCGLAENGSQVIVTISQKQYKIWVNLRVEDHHLNLMDSM